MAQDVLRNVTYVLRDIGVYLQIGVVRDGSYSVLFERSNVESLTVDWVANVLYWIESGTVVSSRFNLSICTVIFPYMLIH